MRVLAVGNLYPPHHLGGYELAWRSAMHDLRRRGHEVRVLASDIRLAHAQGPEEPGTFRELRSYWREHAFPQCSLAEAAALERHNGTVLERHLREQRPQVVNWWAMGGLSLSLIERVRRRPLPAVAVVADDWLAYGPKVDRWLRAFRRSRLLAAGAERLTGLPARVDFDRAAHYVLVSEHLRAAARAGGLALPSSEVAGLGVDTRSLSPRTARPWAQRLLYVGRIDARKGISDAIEALAMLEGDATLTIAGEGDPAERQRIETLIARLGLGERVHLMGMQARAQLADTYAAADVVLFPVRWPEPWGLVPLEAMALGRPVIATGTGGSGEYLRDGANCLRVAPERPAELAAAVRSLRGDPQLRARLVAGGLQTAREHSEDRFHGRLVDALERSAATAVRGAA